MIMSSTRGFTVIELMLFLGVTGALFAALMFGVNSSVNQQRYRESVVSFSTLLQGQYSEVSNTRNDSNNDWKCAADGTLQPADDVNGSFRGTSPCVLLGEAIQIKNGTEIGIYKVIGCEPLQAQDPSQSGGATANSCGNASTHDVTDANDLDTLKAYNPKVTTFSQHLQTVDWNSTLATTGQKHDPLNASFLILRSPSSGLLRVFVAPNLLPSDLKTMLDPSNASLKQPFTMCVEGDSIISAKQSITIDPSVSGPAGVSVNQADTSLCA